MGTKRPAEMRRACKSPSSGDLLDRAMCVAFEREPLRALLQACDENHAADGGVVVLNEAVKIARRHAQRRCGHLGIQI